MPNENVCFEQCPSKMYECYNIPRAANKQTKAPPKKHKLLHPVKFRFPGDWDDDDDVKGDAYQGNSGRADAYGWVDGGQLMVGSDAY